MGYEFLNGLTIEKLNKEQFNSIQELEEYAMYLVEDDENSQIIVQNVEPQNPEENTIWVDTSNEVEEVAQDDTALKQILNVIFPIGYIYISSSSNNPADIYGVGTWQQIKDTFILAAGDTYAAGSTGGEATHTLTVNEMPNHRHSISTEGGSVSKTTSYIAGASGSSGGKGTGYTNWSDTSGSPHNNMPPYITKYVWERIA